MMNYLFRGKAEWELVFFNKYINEIRGNKLWKSWVR